MINSSKNERQTGGPYDSSRRSATGKRLWKDPKYREKLATMNLGRRFSQEWRRNMSAARAPKSTITASETELAYMAGIVDGEGTIGIYRRSRGTLVSTPILSLKVANTSADLLAWIAAKFGGRILPNQVRNAAHKPTGTWCVVCASAAGIIEKITPFLVVKKVQADLALQFAVHRFDSLEIAESYRLKMKALNKRGCAQ